ncbi:MAG: GNAT family N-acetyltransferase [Chloroflexi bacterium]|nr:GNAT family N-acetyltransferase [Chloroflexota bacterium]
MNTLLKDGYAIRRATLFDLRAVYRLERVIFPRDAYPYLDLALLFLTPRVINRKIVAPDGALVGFVCAVLGARQDRGWIVTIGIDPAHQRRGLGQALLAHAEERIGRTHIRLTVREGNHPAIRLYARTGYTTIERKIGYYRDGETGLVMEKHMNPAQN